MKEKQEKWLGMGLSIIAQTQCANNNVDILKRHVTRSLPSPSYILIQN